MGFAPLRGSTKLAPADEETMGKVWECAPDAVECVHGFPPVTPVPDSQTEEEEAAPDLTWLWILIAVLVTTGIVLLIVFTLPKEEEPIEIKKEEKKKVKDKITFDVSSDW